MHRWCTIIIKFIVENNSIPTELILCNLILCSCFVDFSEKCSPHTLLNFHLWKLPLTLIITQIKIPFPCRQAPEWALHGSVKATRMESFPGNFLLIIQNISQLTSSPPPHFSLIVFVASFCKLYFPCLTSNHRTELQASEFINISLQSCHLCMSAPNKKLPSDVTAGRASAWMVTTSEKLFFLSFFSLPLFCFHESCNAVTSNDDGQIENLILFLPSWIAPIPKLAIIKPSVWRWKLIPLLSGDRKRYKKSTFPPTHKTKSSTRSSWDANQ